MKITLITAALAVLLTASAHAAEPAPVKDLPITSPLAVATASATSSAPTSVQVTGDSFPRQTASAIAPTVVNVAPCTVGAGLGVQGPGAGFSLGFGRKDRGCDRRANAALLQSLGYGREAVQVLCLEADVRRAAPKLCAD